MGRGFDYIVLSPLSTAHTTRAGFLARAANIIARQGIYLKYHRLLQYVS
jgi:hypothetical protein